MTLETALIVIALLLSSPLWIPFVFIIILAALVIIGGTLIVPWLVVLGYWSDKSDLSDQSDTSDKKN